MEHAILLVDDDDNTLSSLVRALRKQPYAIYTARNGSEAVWILKSRKIDVIVADERMPEISGSELLAWTAEHYPNVMRIVLTGHAETDTAIRAINECSVCHFFTKPCDEVRLAAVIRKASEEKQKGDAERYALDLSNQHLRDLEELGQDIAFQTRIICQDLQRPVKNILECCQRLELQSHDASDAELDAFLGDARGAIAEIRRLTANLQASTLLRSHEFV